MGVSVNKEVWEMAKRQDKEEDKMATTGIRRLKGEEYPFGQGNREPVSFGDLFDDATFVEKMSQVRPAGEKGRLRGGGIKSYPPPQETLDLHGYTGQEAEDKARAFVMRAGRCGLQAVRIITGKGLHSPGGKAVLPDVVEQLLILLKKEGGIVAFQWDRKLKSKSGALLVYL